MRFPDDRTDAGPRDEFTLLLQPVLPKAYRRAAHLARQHADAEDLVQETAMLAYRYFSRYRSGTNFQAWFFRILTNRFYTLRRRRPWQRRETAFYEEHDHGEAASRPDESPAQLVEQDQRRRLIADALAALPSEYRVVCTLYFVDDLPYVDIARRLRIPLGTVRSRLHRGRHLLRQVLRPVAVDCGFTLPTRDHGGPERESGPSPRAMWPIRPQLTRT